MKINKDWWKDFFNQIYLLTDSRSVCDPSLTCREVSLVEKILNLNKSDRILDLCGGYGRHSLELARRGYCHLTVLDFSDYQIKLGKNLAKKENLSLKFLRKDARFSGLKPDCYSVVMIMANSFGYFTEENENLKILKETHRLLKSNGKLLLDLADAEFVKKNLKAVSWHQANDDVFVCRRRELNNDLIKAKEIVISQKKGLLREGFYCERLYNKDRINRLLKRAGFKKLSIKNNFSLHEDKKDYGLLSSRMMIKAIKS